MSGPNDQHGTLFDASWNPNGGPVHSTWTPGDQHVTAWWENSPVRFSHDNNDSHPHYTNQDLPKGDPHRHDPP